MRWLKAWTDQLLKQYALFDRLVVRMPRGVMFAAVQIAKHRRLLISMSNDDQGNLQKTPMG